MNIAICQINTTVGDFAGNTALICEHISWARGQGADLVLFPEMAVCGYPPRDLLDRASFVDANLAALNQVIAASQGLHVVVGYVARNDAPTGPWLFNSAALIADGRLVASQHKTLLPAYDVFDESRHFAPATGQCLFDVAGRRLGITICEDGWAHHEDWRGRRLYRQDPMRTLGEAGADLVVNISASPFCAGKVAVRHDLLAQAARTHGYPVIYVNLVGGNDQLVFDGGSFALNARGDVVWQMAQCAATRALIDDTVLTGSGIAVPSLAPEEEICAALELGLADYLRKCGFSQVVIGLSGGIDSAVVAAIAVRVLGPAAVCAIAMPSRFSSPASVTDAQALAATLGMRCDVIPIDPLYEAFRQVVGSGQPADCPDLAEENLQARIRGTILMTHSNRTGAMVLSTGNKSEMAVGYCTLYGDMAGGLALLGDVPKTMVYRLAALLNRDREIIPQSILTKAPSAELRPNQTDQQTLPPYPLLDQILQLFIEEHQSVEEIVAHGLDRAMVEAVVARIDRAEYKREQAPPCIQVSRKAFGRGRRLPIARA